MRTDLELLAGSWLLTYTLHSTLLLGLAWVLTRWRPETAPRREWLWKAALVGGLITASAQAVLDLEPMGGVVSLARSTPASDAAVTAPDGGAESWRGLVPALEASRRLAAVAAEPARSVPPSAPVSGLEATTPEPPAPARAPLSGMALALIGWGVIGGALLLAYAGQRFHTFRGMGPRVPVTDPALLAMLDGLRADAGVRRPIRLTRAPGLASPVALGWREIALPDAALTELDPAQQRGLLAHELAHLVRLDPLWLALGCVMERAFFFQPLNRLARIRLQEAAEYLCDDWAVHRTGSGMSLATCLLKVAEWVTAAPQPLPLAGMAERRSQLVTRIHRLLEGRTMSASPRSIWLAGGALLLLGVTALAVPTVTAEAQQPVRPDSVAAERQDTVMVEARSPMTSAYRRLLSRMRSSSVRAQLDAERALARMRPPRPPRAPMPAIAPMPDIAVVAPRAPEAPRAPTPPPGMAAVAARLDAWRARDWPRPERRRDTTNIAVPALIAALKDPVVEVRRAAAASLANLSDVRAVPALITALGDTDTEVRASAAEALGELEDRRAVPGLVGLLKDKSPEVRRQALGALSNFEGGVPPEAIYAAIADADPEVRLAGLSLALSRANDRDENAAPDPKLESTFVGLLGDSSAEMRQLAIEGVASMHLKKIPPRLLELRTDRSADVRQALANALGEIGDPAGVATLKALLGDSNADVRESAVSALGEIRDQAALETLVGALRSTDPVVRRQAAEALGQRDEDWQ